MDDRTEVCIYILINFGLRKRCTEYDTWIHTPHIRNNYFVTSNIQYSAGIHYAESIIGIDAASASTSGEKDDSSTLDYFVITSNRHIMPASKNAESWCWGHATLFISCMSQRITCLLAGANATTQNGVVSHAVAYIAPNPPSVLPCRRKLGWQPSHPLPASPTKAWK
jgi:hypothetical protein